MKTATYKNVLQSVQLPQSVKAYAPDGAAAVRTAKAKQSDMAPLFTAHGQGMLASVGIVDADKPVQVLSA